MCSVFGFQGATLQVDEQSGAVFIARIFHGGAADRSGKNRRRLIRLPSRVK